MSTTMTLSTPPGMIFGPPVREGNSVYNVNYSTIEALTQDVPALIERGFLPVDPYLRAMVEWVKIQGGNVPPTPEPFWEPFTVTVGEGLNMGENGYFRWPGDDPVGSITNEPVDGYSIEECFSSGTVLQFKINGPHALAEELSNASIGVNGVDVGILDISSSRISANPDVWQTYLTAEPVTPWTPGQQIPIVIIPKGSPSA